MDLGSDVITEVEIQPQMEEVETYAVDMSGDEDTIEIAAVDNDVDLPDDILLQNGGFSELLGNTGDILITPHAGPSRPQGMHKKQQRKVPNGRKKVKEDHMSSNGSGNLVLTGDPNGKRRKWEPKQVQIRTLEGEFSVTMWASGSDDSKYFLDTYDGKSDFVILFMLSMSVFLWK